MTRCELYGCDAEATWDVSEGCYLCERHARDLADAETEAMLRDERGWHRWCEDQAALWTEPEPWEKP